MIDFTAFAAGLSLPCPSCATGPAAGAAGDGAQRDAQAFGNFFAALARHVAKQQRCAVLVAQRVDGAEDAVTHLFLRDLFDDAAVLAILD